MELITAMGINFRKNPKKVINNKIIIIENSPVNLETWLDLIFIIEIGRFALEGIPPKKPEIKEIDPRFINSFFTSYFASVIPSSIKATSSVDNEAYTPINKAEGTCFK